MNQNLEFRAWDKVKKVMHTAYSSDLVLSLDGNLMEVIGGGMVDNYPNCILMQYTGLTLKNGKKVFVGDVLVTKFERFPNEPEESKGPNPNVFYSVVIFDNARAAFVDPTCKRDMEVQMDFLGQILNDNDVDVLGNIYENPELQKLCKYKVK